MSDCVLDALVIFDGASHSDAILIGNHAQSRRLTDGGKRPSRRKNHESMVQGKTFKIQTFLRGRESNLW